MEGDGNAYDFGARILDVRLGRWLSLDALASKYPKLSPYNFVGNNPIFFIDPDGNKIVPTITFKGTNYELVHNYLMKNNDEYKKLLGTYTNENDEANLLNLNLNNKEK